MKLNKRAKVSLFRAISFTDERNFITWLDIILNYPTSSIDLIVMNNKEVPTEYIFDWPNSMYKTWVLFEVTLSENRDLSTVSMRSAGTDFVQTLVVTDGIYLPLLFHYTSLSFVSKQNFFLIYLTSFQKFRLQLHNACFCCSVMMLIRQHTKFTE